MSKRSKRTAEGGAAIAEPMEVERTANPFDSRDVVYISIDEIEASPFNTRTVVDVEDLVPVIREEGVLSPVLVRPVDRSTIARQDLKAWQLVAGHRRLAAVRAIGWDVIPAINLGEISDQKAREVQAIENLQRKDMNPVEEANAFAALRLGGMSIEDVAARAGRHITYVRQRLYLLDRLPSDLLEAVAGGTFSVAAALEVARVEDEKGRKAIAKDLLARNPESDPVTAREAFEAANKFVLRLSEAPFDIEDVDLVPVAGSCVACPKRSGNSRDLFGSKVDDTDTCLDAKCHGEKVRVSFEVNAERAKAAGATVMSKAESGKVFDAWDYKPRHKTLRDVEDGTIASNTEWRNGQMVNRGETWRQVIDRIKAAGGDVPVVIAQVPRTGAAMILVDMKAVTAEAKRVKVKFGKATAGKKKKGPATTEEVRAKETAAVTRETERQIRERVLQACKAETTPAQTRAIVEVLVKRLQMQGAFDLANEIIGKGTIEKKGAHLFEAGEKGKAILLDLVRKGSGSAATQVLVGIAMYEADLLFDEKAVKGLREAFGVVLADVRKDVQAQRTAASKAQEKADGSKAGGRAAGPAGGRRARQVPKVKKGAGPLARKKKR